METTKDQKKIKSLPKAEIHCHIDGILDPAILRQLEQDGVDLPLTTEELLGVYPVHSYDLFVHWFEATKPIDGRIDLFKCILAQHVDRLIAQNVTYTEIMLGSSELPKDEGLLVEQFRAFRVFADSLEKGVIQVEFLVAVGRGVHPDVFENVAARVIQLRKAGLLFGIALAGWPETPIRRFKRTLAHLHDSGVGIEIHAGEWGGPDLVRDALKHGSPDRIGHGVAIFQDPKLVERFQRDQIHIEFCPTSNLKTGSVQRIESHPVRLARELELNFSINTDDPGPFQTSMDSEYQLLVETFGFGINDFKRIYANTLAARFQPDLRYLTRTGHFGYAKITS